MTLLWPVAHGQVFDIHQWEPLSTSFNQTCRTGCITLQEWQPTTNLLFGFPESPGASLFLVSVASVFSVVPFFLSFYLSFFLSFSSTSFHVVADDTKLKMVQSCKERPPFYPLGLNVAFPENDKIKHPFTLIHIIYIISARNTIGVRFLPIHASLSAIVFDGESFLWDVALFSWSYLIWWSANYTDQSPCLLKCNFLGLYMVVLVTSSHFRRPHFFSGHSCWPRHGVMSPSSSSCWMHWQIHGCWTVGLLPASLLRFGI